MCDHMDECRPRFDKIDEALKDLNTRLFKGNGKEPFDVRLTRVEDTAKTFNRAVWLFAAGIVTFVGKIIYDGFTG